MLEELQILKGLFAAALLRLCGIWVLGFGAFVARGSARPLLPHHALTILASMLAAPSRPDALSGALSRREERRGL